MKKEIKEKKDLCKTCKNMVKGHCTAEEGNPKMSAKIDECICFTPKIKEIKEKIIIELLRKYNIASGELVGELLELFAQEKQKQVKEIKELKEALIWCSGSEDFQEGGKARKGWVKICVPLLKEKK